MPWSDPSNPYLVNAASALVESIQDRILFVRARDFPTETPLVLADNLQKITDSIQATLATTTDDRTLQFCLFLLKRLGSHLRYIEGASADKIPWGLIRPIERLLREVVPGSSAMVRARWSYNYSIFELNDYYRKALKPLLSANTLQGIFGDPNQKFFLVSAPLIERDNILLHLVLGHEIGHRIADACLEGEDKVNLLNSVAARIGDGKWYDPEIESLGPLIALQRRQALMSRILEIRRRGLEEIISDLSGLYLFGPAFLFALNEFAYDDVLDSLPTPDQYYPPWRFRYRECLKVFDAINATQLGTFLGNGEPAPRVKEAYDARVEYLRQITGSNADVMAIDRDNLIKRAYAEIAAVLPTISPFIMERLGPLVYEISLAKDDFPVLLERLAAGVPPNEGAKGTCDFRSAFTVGWLVRLAKVPIPFDPNVRWQYEHDLTLCRLVHKAIEYTEISREYNVWKSQAIK